MNVANQKIVRKLSWQSMRMATTRNRIAIVAIALTTILFTSLFTITLSVNQSFQEANFRQAGGWVHGSFKNLNEKQLNELKDDPLIQQYGIRRIVGMPTEAPFVKEHVEIGYSDANQAHWMYCDPIKGTLPTEQTNEAATDLHVLKLLGVEPVIGNKFTMTFTVNGEYITETFTLSGWWERDEAITASHVLLPDSRALEILKKTGLDGTIGTGYSGALMLDVMLPNSLQIEEDLIKILDNHNYGVTDFDTTDTNIDIGVNFGYTGAQLVNNIDPTTAAGLIVLLIIIILTGYLIIYNVFQISVVQNIRFYGLLKTIGTTGRQLRTIIRLQAMLLSCIGIPIGLFIGYIIGILLTPTILALLNDTVKDTVSFNPIIFIVSALFSFITVLISSYRPGRLASKVSPIEAVRYTEGTVQRQMHRSSKSGRSIYRMSWINFSRNRLKTLITVLSLSLSILLLNITVTFTSGFNMDKYLSNMASDFIVADARYFQVTTIWNSELAIGEDIISTINNQWNIEQSGRTYAKEMNEGVFITEDIFRKQLQTYYDEQQINTRLQEATRNADHLVLNPVRLYGMEPFVLDKLQVLDGDLTKLDEPHSIAAVYRADDYGKPEMNSHWAKIGDTVTIRYEDNREVHYEVAALVIVPRSFNYRSYGVDEFVLNDHHFIQDAKSTSIMYYAFDVEKSLQNQVEKALQRLTTTDLSEMDYESKSSYAEEFQSFQQMFLLFGSVLSFIIGLIGVLNLMNVIITSIFTRRRELAMLQSIGMTQKQTKKLLVLESFYYAASAIVASLLLIIALSPFLAQGLSVFWFFTFRFTVAPVLIIAPIFITLSIIIPLLVYRKVSKQSIVERLREAE